MKKNAIIEAIYKVGQNVYGINMSLQGKLKFTSLAHLSCLRKKLFSSHNKIEKTFKLVQGCLGPTSKWWPSGSTIPCSLATNLSEVFN